MWVRGWELSELIPMLVTAHLFDLSRCNGDGDDDELEVS
jgi:hypothetical protein